MEFMQCDVLVIGGGSAAGRAAIAAHDVGASVLMVVKGKLGGGASGFSMSEMAGYNSPDGTADASDSPEAFYNDIMDAAMGMADPAAAQVVAENAMATVAQLEEWGVKFERNVDGGFYAFKSCYSTKARTHVIKGHGEPIVRAQTEQITKRDIAVREGMCGVALVVVDGEIAGLVALDSKGGKIAVAAKAVIMATGGATQAIARNMNPKEISGDGYAMAYRAGAQLVNMEFMQAGMGFVYPATSLINAYIWGSHPRLTNAAGYEFMNDLPEGLDWKEVMDEHRKHFPFSSRDISRWLEASIQREAAEGRATAHGGVYADFTMMTNEYVSSLSDEYGVHRMWPIARDYFLSKGIDVLAGGTEVGCFSHAVNGGVKIDAQAATSIPGLYAAGETAGGPHGADRLGGNMFVTCQIYGKIAGTNAAAYAKARNTLQPKQTAWAQAFDEIADTLYGDFDATAIRQQLAQAGQEHLLVRRTESGLASLLTRIDALECAIGATKTGAIPHPENLSTANLLLSARLMATAALRRRESRGSHFREDYPDTDPAQGTPLVIDKSSTI